MKKISDYLGIEITEEMLIGRNYYHYSNGVLDDNHRRKPLLKEVYKGTRKTKFDPDLGIREYLFNDCWIKRIIALTECGPECEVIILKITDNKLSNYKILCDMSFGEEVERKSYLELRDDQVTDDTVDEFDKLSKKIFLKKGISFKNKPMPKYMFLGLSYENPTRYLYSIQSPYRLANITCDIFLENKLISYFDYSPYYSSLDDCYGDMFSRPKLVKPDEREMMYILLSIYDAYDYYNEGYDIFNEDKNQDADAK